MKIEPFLKKFLRIHCAPNRPETYLKPYETCLKPAKREGNLFEMQMKRAYTVTLLVYRDSIVQTQIRTSILFLSPTQDQEPARGEGDGGRKPRERSEINPNS